jgi:hypothetical protein
VLQKNVDDFESDKLYEFLLEIDQMACFMKDSTFGEEKEVRVVVSLFDKEKDNIKFRVGNGTIIPYVEIPFPEHAVSKIIIGPTIDPQRAEKALTQFIASNFTTSKPEIVHSKIPFRSW